MTTGIVPVGVDVFRELCEQSGVFYFVMMMIVDSPPWSSAATYTAGALVMRGCISLRTSGTYSVVVEIGRNAQGKRRQISRGGFRTKKEAEVALAELLHEIQGGGYTKPREVRLGEYLTEWLESVRPNLSGRSYERYRVIVEQHLIPAIGQVKLAELRPPHIQKLYSRWQKPGPDGAPRWSRATLRKHHNVLHHALRDAVRLQFIAVNPADGVEPPHVSGEKKAIQVLSEAQTAELLRRAQGTRLHLPILLAVTSGLRRGELLALRWSDIDFTAGCPARRAGGRGDRRRSALQEPEDDRQSSPCTVAGADPGRAASSQGRAGRRAAGTWGGLPR